MFVFTCTVHKTEICFELKPKVLSTHSLCMHLVLFVLSPGYCFTAEDEMEKTNKQQTTGGCTTTIDAHVDI